jgi:hypothetical protein
MRDVLGGFDKTNEEAGMSSRVNHQEIVKKALDTKAVDFAAIGKMIAEMGPSISLADEPWDGFCGTMRLFIHLYILGPGTGGVTVENLEALRSASAKLGS